MLGLICFVCLLVFFHTHISFFVDAKEVESPWVLTEDIVIDGENPEYEKINTNALIEIGNSAVVEFRNLTINVSNNMPSLFKVNTGSKLILNNVTINSIVIIDSVICNYGQVEINNTQFPKVNSKYSILNDSSENDAILLHYVGDKQIKNIYLKSGSIYVTDDTHFEVTSDYINIQVTDSYDELLDNTHIGRGVVKGKNTFAGYYLNNFRLVGAPFEPNISPTETDAWSMFQNKFYLDYVGLIGDNPSNSSSGLSTFYYNGNDDTKTPIDFVKSGDIIITKPVIYLQKNTQIFVGSKFSTSRLFQKYNNDETYCVSAKVVEDCSKSYQSKCLVLDNATSLIGNLSNNAIIRRSADKIVKSDVVKLNILDTSTSKTTTKNISVSALQNVNETLYESSHIEFVSTYGYQVDSISSNGLKNDNDLVVIQTKEFMLINLKMLSTVDNAKVNITMSPLKPKPVKKSVYLENTTFEFNNTNRIESLVPYVLDKDNNKVYLKSEEFWLLDANNQVIKDITNAGSYQVFVNSTNEDTIFVNNQFDVTISKKQIRLEFENIFTYDGNYHTAKITNIIGVIVGDKIDLSAFEIQSPQIIPGEYSQTVTLDSQNYYLIESCKTVNLTIKKLKINLNTVVFNSATFTYDKDKSYSLSITGLKDEYKDIVEVSYSGNGQTDVLLDSNGNVTAYTVYANFQVDENLYELTNGYTRTAKLTILKQFVDLSSVSLPNVSITYDGLEHDVQIVGTVPSQISNYVYYNNTPKKEVGTYNIKVVFKLSDTKNYTLTNNGMLYNSLSCKLVINPKIITMEYINQVLEFEGDIVKYDGKVHKLKTILKDSSLISISNSQATFIDIGLYDCIIKINLKDSKNYIFENGTANVELTKTLQIIKGDANFDGITFENKTTTYNYNTIKITANNLPSYCEVKYEYSQNGKVLNTDGVSDAGEYLVKAYITLSKQMANNYNEKSLTLTATLTINKLVLDCSNIRVENYSCIYDGLAHNIIIQGDTNQIKFEYSQKDLVDAGTYQITVTPIENKNIEYSNLNSLKATLIIFKADYNMNSVKFKDITEEYDGNQKVALISGTLPKGVYVASYQNNKHTHVSANSDGIEIARVKFATDDTNYNTPSDMTCKIKIKPRKVNVVLNQTQFKYSGEEILIEGRVIGIIDGDQVNIEFNNNKNINVGKYSTGAILDNRDYICGNTSSLSYEINPAQIDTSDFEFEDVKVTYDGLEHQPKFKGNLPVGVYANLVSGKIVNAGNYTAYIEFKSSNKNYILPQNLVAQVEILPKPILLEFSEYTNLVEDGSVHPVTIRLLGTIEDDFEDYTVTYSASPIKAGIYKVTVNLNANSNYTILSSNSLTYEILTNNKTYVGDGVVINIKGDGFSSSASLNACDVDVSEFDQILQESASIKKYDAFKLEIDGTNSNKEIDVTYKSGTSNINAKYIRVYKISNGNLLEVEFETIRNQLKFSANIDDKIIIIEQKDSVEMTSRYIYLIVILSVVSIIIMTLIIYKNIKSRKKIENFINIIDD